MIIERMSLYFANYIHQTSDRSVSVPVLSYALLHIINLTFITLLSMTVGVITGKLWETILALVCFGAFRQVSGGFHLRNMDQCMVVSTALIAIIPHIPMPVNSNLIFTSVSLVLVLVYAPALSKQTSRRSGLKMLSILFVLLNFYLQSDLLAKALLVQSLTIISVRG